MITEQKFGKLTILSELGLRKYGNQNYTHLRVKCECGSEFELPATRVYSGQVKSCGCLKHETGKVIASKFNPKQTLPIGKKFGKLTVLEDAGRQNYHNNPTRHVNARCECGSIVCKPLYEVKTGKVQSCGCAVKKHASNLGLSRRLPSGEASLNALYGTYAKRAKRKGLPFELTLQQFKEITQRPCTYCGTQPHLYHKASHYYGGYVYNGIDRLNNDEGYTAYNTTPCCEICNRAKSSMARKDFLAWLKKIREPRVPKPTGDVEITSITDTFGKDIPLSKAFKYGWLVAPSENGRPLNPFNLFVDQGRQLLAYAFGFRAPISNYTCQKFGVGTGLTAAQVTDVALEAPVALTSQSGATTAPVASIDFLTAFVVRVGFTIATGDANGYLLTEYGLFSGNGTLLARFVRSVGINKTSDFAPTLTWRIRF